MGNNLVSRMNKKQNSISLSTAEAEYIAVGICCTQLLWMQKLLYDYGICQKHLTIYCDNTSTINIFKKPIQHSRTKHIEIRHHFIREPVEDGTLTPEFIHSDDQKADLFTKPLTIKASNSFIKTLVLSPWDDQLLLSSLLMHLHLVLCFTLFDMFLFGCFSIFFFIYFVF